MFASMCFGSQGLPRCPCTGLAMLGETVSWGSTQLRTGPVRHISLLPSDVAGGGGGVGAGPELTTESTDKTALNPAIPDDNRGITRAHAAARSPNPVARGVTRRTGGQPTPRTKGTWLSPPRPKKKKNCYNGAARDTNAL